MAGVAAPGSGNTGVTLTFTNVAGNGQTQATLAIYYQPVGHTPIPATITLNGIATTVNFSALPADARQGRLVLTVPGKANWCGDNYRFAEQLFLIPNNRPDHRPVTRMRGCGPNCLSSAPLWRIWPVARSKLRNRRKLGQRRSLWKRSPRRRHGHPPPESAESFAAHGKIRHQMEPAGRVEDGGSRP